TMIGEQQKPPAWMHFNLGLAFKVLGRFEEAEGEYSRAIQLEPSYGAAYGNRGNVRLLRNNVEGAVADYRMAVMLNRKDQTARDNLKSIEAALRKIGADKSGKGAGADLCLKDWRRSSALGRDDNLNVDVDALEIAEKIDV